MVVKQECKAVELFLLHGVQAGLLYGVQPGLLRGVQAGLLHGVQAGLLYGMLAEITTATYGFIFFQEAAVPCTNSLVFVI